jgi:hypothetical protein
MESEIWGVESRRHIAGFATMMIFAKFGKFGDATKIRVL